MIGGIEIVIRSLAGSHSLELAANAVRQEWPDAIFADAESGEPCADACEISVHEVRELFVYQNAAAELLWREKGAVPEARNTMIHLLYDPGQVTVVIDDEDDQMHAALQAIQSALADQSIQVG